MGRFLREAADDACCGGKGLTVLLPLDTVYPRYCSVITFSRGPPGTPDPSVSLIRTASFIFGI